MKICIVTPQKMNPPAMRVKQIIRLINKVGISRISLFNNVESRLTRRYPFLFKGVKAFCSNYDIYIVYDLATLIFLGPFFKEMKRRGKLIIYDSIDFFPGYYSYKILKKIKFIKKYPLLFFTEVLKEIERKILNKTCSKIIVNSDFLERYYKDLIADMPLYKIYYSSPFETFSFKNNYKNNNIAIIYLGSFSYEKGADDFLTLALANKNIPFYIIGDIEMNKETLPANVIWYPRLNLGKLQKILEVLLKKYYLIGFSAIKTDNPSYAVQEANKDIDYLSLGIPILGNERSPTKEKILYGAGIFLKDKVRFKKLKHSISLRKYLTDKALALYHEKYHSSNFVGKIYSILRDE